jgi:quercetin dioxygenase-like cupin family protein/iron-sulfur cluster repair protein YtfE (RIC family)
MTATTRSIIGKATELAQFETKGFGRRTLVETDRFKAVIAALEDGQQIPLHAPPLDLVMTIVEGVGRVMAGDEAQWVRAGDVVVVPAGEMRALRAVGGRLVVVNVVSPPPGEGDHASSAQTWPADVKAPDVAELILEEHGHLFPHLKHLGELAAESTTLSEPELRRGLAKILDFLRNGLLPHAGEEEVSVYPAVEKVLRAIGGATHTMSIDHRFVGQMVNQLEGLAAGALSEREREQVRRLLYGLQTLLEVHFTKENEAYVPLLNRLSPAERRELYERLAGGDHQHHHEEA